MNFKVFYSKENEMNEVIKVLVMNTIVMKSLDFIEY